MRLVRMERWNELTPPPVVRGIVNKGDSGGKERR